MKKILIVVDMQNDFITGPLGTPEAVSIVDNVVEKIRGEEWDAVIATQDTHYEESYFDTQEGKKLNTGHCFYRTSGHDLHADIRKALVEVAALRIEKDTFGTLLLCIYLEKYCVEDTDYEDIELTLVGVCTDICVISNALLLKTYYPEMKIVVDASCCAGSTPEKHRMALEVMKSCQVDIVNVDEEHIKELCKSALNAIYGTAKKMSD